MDNKQQLARNLAPVLNWAKKNKQRINALSAMTSTASLNGEEEKELKFTLPTDFTGKDYLTMLLHIDAEIEHGLMLQYLYSAYSIGGPQIPDKYKDKVKTWQQIILGIAKEEMGHFVSVQNVLKLIGAPLNFGRESYPWDTPFYPFPFTLEKFTIDSLAKYIYAEAPAQWLESDDPIAKEVSEKVHASVSDPHTVGALFKIILQLVKDPQYIPDDVFQADTYTYQAKFDEWGRGYTGGNRGAAHHSKFTHSPDVLVAPLLSRDDAYNALNEIAEQGEGEDIASDTPSHFERFLYIYKELRAILVETNNSFTPSRNVANNPWVACNAPDTGDVANPGNTGEITDPTTCLWANLFNIRYRMLLNYLNHSFLLDNGYNNTGALMPRGLIINSTFGEMYNLRSLATILVQLPLAPGNTTVMAGPPFTMPYSIDLPFGEHNRWRLHQDLLQEAGKLITDLCKVADQQQLRYLYSLQELDNKMLQSIEQLTQYIV